MFFGSRAIVSTADVDAASFEFARRAAESAAFRASPAAN
jgi:hypothetical protein